MARLPTPSTINSTVIVKSSPFIAVVGQKETKCRAHGIREFAARLEPPQVVVRRLAGSRFGNLAGRTPLPGLKARAAERGSPWGTGR